PRVVAGASRRARGLGRRRRGGLHPDCLPGGRLRQSPASGTTHTSSGSGMIFGMRPGSGLPAASQHGGAGARGTAAAGGLRLHRRVRPAFRRGWLWLWVLAVGALVAVARLPGMASDLRAVFAHLGDLRPAWLGVAAAAELASLTGGAAAQRQLLAADGTQLPWWTVFGGVLASTGLATGRPAGPVPGGACHMPEYPPPRPTAPAPPWPL